MTKEVEDWFTAHFKYHSAVETYNARVRFIRSQESVGRQGEFNASGEYRIMNEAQRAALRADETLYQNLLKERGPQEAR